MPEEDDEGEESTGPKRERVEQVPLGIRKPKAPKFDASQHTDRQRREDDERESEQLRRAQEGDLDVPDLHKDYEIQDGEEFDRHLEGITSINALKELIAQAKEEVEQELDLPARPFSQERLDELMVFTKEAVIGYGEATGYAELKRRVRDLITSDLRFAQEELDRKKDAYLRSSGG